MGCSASITCYPAKIPHCFKNPQILAFYAILLNTPFIACKSFVQALSLEFKGLCVAWHYLLIDGLNGLRLVPRVDASLARRPFGSLAEGWGISLQVTVSSGFGPRSVGLTGVVVKIRDRLDALSTRWFKAPERTMIDDMTILVFRVLERTGDLPEAA